MKKFKCRRCKEEMKECPSADFMAAFVGQPYWCNNRRCAEYGYVVMVGIIEGDEKE